MKKPRKLTLRRAEALIRRDHPGLWETMTPAEHRQAVEMLNAEAEAAAAETKAKADRAKLQAEFEAFFRRQMRRPRR